MKNVIKKLADQIYSSAASISHIDDINLPKEDNEQQARDMALAISYASDILEHAIYDLREERNCPPQFTRERARRMLDLSKKMWKAWHSINEPNGERPNGKVSSQLYRCAADLKDWARKEPANDWGSMRHWGEV